MAKGLDRFSASRPRISPEGTLLPGVLINLFKSTRGRLSYVLAPFILASGLALATAPMVGCSKDNDGTEQVADGSDNGGSDSEDSGAVEDGTSGGEDDSSVDGGMEETTSSEPTLTGAYCVYFFNEGDATPNEPDALAELSLTQDGTSLDGTLMVVSPEVVDPEQPLQSSHVTDLDALSFWATFYNESTGDSTSLTSTETDPSVVEGEFGRVWTEGSLGVFKNGTFYFGELPCVQE